MIRIICGSSSEGKNYIEALKKRAGDIDKDILCIVDKILSDVKVRGDEAVIEYTRRFDSQKVDKGSIVVSSHEIERAYELVDREFLEAITEAKNNIQEFHEKQKHNSWIITKEDGVVLGQNIRALESVGIYVPGGTASYPSSVIMNAVPARIAGVENLVMTTPPLKDGSINPHVLVAADMSGIKKIYKVGGAQAVAALAFGTETIPRVDKIVGPGNIYVAMAKRAVYGFVDIDMIAGPSEILIIADEDANEKFIAADLMSQAEHDKLASAILITTSIKLAKRVKEELKRQVEEMNRRDIIKSSIENYGAIIVVKDMKEAVDTANNIAPEHLEVMVKEPFLLLGGIKNAGSIFLGEYSPEPLGDYMAGPNHTLPTSGTARFFSPLSVDDFVKKSSFIHYTDCALYKVKEKIVKLAQIEGLSAHENSIKVRFE